VGSQTIHAQAESDLGLRVGGRPIHVSDHVVLGIAVYSHGIVERNQYRLEVGRARFAIAHIGERLGPWALAVTCSAASIRLHRRLEMSRQKLRPGGPDLWLISDGRCQWCRSS
jgi:hypothetical protein